MTTTDKLNMDLQYFAENNGSGDGNGEGDNGNNPDQTGNDAGKDSDVTFTDAQQDKVNEVVQQRLDKAQQKWQATTDQQIKDAIADYQKKSGMTPEQIKEQEQDDKDKELTALQNKLSERDRLDHARQAATEVGLPSVFVKYVVADSDENTDKNAAEFSKIFKGAVQADVEKQLKGKSLPGQGGVGGAKEGTYGEKLAKQFVPEQPKSSYFG